MRRTNYGLYCSLFTAIAFLMVTGSGLTAAGAEGIAPNTTHDAAKPAPDAADRMTTLTDLQATLTVTQTDTKELDKIGKDFSLIYRLRNIVLYYKASDRVRLEGSSHVYGDALLISNGPSVFYAVPRMRIRKTEDLTDAPVHRQSLLELAGIITPETLKLMRAEFVKSDTLDGKPGGKLMEIYDLKFRMKGVGPRYRIWLDPATRVTLKREWYDSANKLRATFSYLAPHEAAPNVWLPDRCEVRNSDSVLAAILTTKDAKVNQKLGDELFEITP